MSKIKKNTMTRDEAKELYADLRKSMASKGAAATRSAVRPPGGKAKSDPEQSKVAAEIAKSIKAALASTPEEPDSTPVRAQSKQFNRGHYGAVALVVSCVALKILLAIIEGSGIMSVASVEASYSGNAPAPTSQDIIRGGISQTGPVFDREQVKVLTQLDARRVELEQRSRRLDDRDSDLEKRDLEFTTRLAQLREMTDRLKVDRERSERKQNSQIEQLANVYGSMNPDEAARLIEQLDITIALALLQKMPEKRMGQILALMTPNKALAITRMLSGSAAL